MRTSYSQVARGRFVDPQELGPGDAVVLLATEADGLLPHHVEAPGLDESLLAVGFVARPGHTAQVPVGGRSVTVVGVEPDASSEVLASRVACGVRATRGTDRVLVDVDVDGTESASAIYLAALLATYRFDHYREATGPQIEELLVVGEPPIDLARLDSLVDAVCFARDLTTLPPADKTPDRLASLLERAAAEAGAEVRRYEEDELRELGMNGLLAVGDASAHRPVLVRLSCSGTGDGTVAVVGKGVTYDAGGVNLKLQMLEMMKLDMAGAAAAAAAVLHAARHPRLNGITVWLGLCENVMSGTAYHAGDVLRMRNGLTVEIVNTDAEGRLTLADGMSMAADEEPDAIVTIATLTGAAMAALGMRTAALMTHDEALAAATLQAAERSGEDVWRMPLRPHLAESLESEIADLNNLGDATRAQTMVAGTFLSRFAPDGTPYAHLDIAGPAYNPGKAYAQVPPGGTGFGVTTLLELLDLWPAADPARAAAPD